MVRPETLDAYRPPADAIIYATARQHAAPLVTKDKRIRAFARATRDVKTVW